VEPKADLSDVVRPRSSPLLLKVPTPYGNRHVWTTFSADQIDLNFANTDVLFEFLDILFLCLSHGMRIVRLDAIAYLWKKVGSRCIHLPETHEVVKLFREILELVAPEALILTETNVPHEENISYFGEGDEAHMVYQFSLPPLLLHALHTGTTRHLSTWAQTVSQTMQRTTYLNFTASHDGIGLRPLQGLIDEAEMGRLLEAVVARGGRVSTRRGPDGSESPYELNISYFDALGDPQAQDAEAQIARFLCSQTVPLCLRGIPAVYFHSLTATPNDLRGVEETGRARSINRHKYEESRLRQALADPGHAVPRVLGELVRLLRIRAQQPAFHPDADQRVSRADERLFAVMRRRHRPSQILLCLSNFTAETVEADLGQLFPGVGRTRPRVDLISGTRLAAPLSKVALAPYQTVWLTDGRRSAGGAGR
jgi:sucrose phosphorylase